MGNKSEQAFEPRASVLCFLLLVLASGLGLLQAAGCCRLLPLRGHRLRGDGPPPAIGQLAAG